MAQGSIDARRRPAKTTTTTAKDGIARRPMSMRSGRSSMAMTLDAWAGTPFRGSGYSEDPGDLEGRGLLQLVVAAVGRLLVGAPSDEGRSVAEARALEMIVGDLHDPLRAERLPGQVLAPVPARPCAGQALAGRLGVAPAGPLPP